MPAEYRNPKPTVDVIIELAGSQIVLIVRTGNPPGLAIPGGFVDEGESVEAAAVREALEETNLVVELLELLYVYSDPRRDPRQHTISTVFVGRAQGEPRAGDDARAVRTVAVHDLESSFASLAFDHAHILRDYLHWKKTGEKPRPGRAAQG